MKKLLGLTVLVVGLLSGCGVPYYVNMPDSDTNQSTPLQSTGDDLDSYLEVNPVQSNPGEPVTVNNVEVNVDFLEFHPNPNSPYDFDNYPIANVTVVDRDINDITTGDIHPAALLEPIFFVDRGDGEFHEVPAWGGDDELTGRYPQVHPQTGVEYGSAFTMYVDAYVGDTVAVFVGGGDTSTITYYTIQESSEILD